MALLFRLFFLLLQLGLSFTVCPIGTIRGVDPGNCYKFHGTPADFDSANIQCVLDGGNLASISSAFINDFISKTVLTSLSDSTMTWIGGKRNETGWTWTDGKPFSYTNWAKGQPSSGNCTSIDPSQSNWYSSNCQSLMPYICEIPAEADSCPVQTTVVSTIKPHCRQEYQYFDKWNSCYKYVTAQQAYNLAEQNCINEGGNLVSIHSPEENEFVDNPACTTCWGWTDGTEVTYTNWLSYDPNITGSSCVDMISSGSSHYGGKNVWENGYWSCTSQLPSICKQAPICNSG